MCIESEKLCVHNVMGELIFQMHGCLLANDGLHANPRSALIISSCLSYLEQHEELPQHLRALCQSLRDDWRQYLDEHVSTGAPACAD